MIQLQFLNYLLKSKDTSLLLVNNINEEFFCDYKDEFNYINEHITNYSKIPDEITFLNKFPDFDLIEVNESASYLIDALYEDRNKRFLASVFNKVRNLVNEDNIEEAMQVYRNAADLAIKAKHLDTFDLINDKSRYDAYVERCQDFGKYYVKTGLYELDEVIGGWDRNEELATIVARPGVGKSWLLLKCAIAALEQGLRVGIYSGEMSEMKVGYRFDTLVSHISNYDISKGRIDVQLEYQKYINELSNKFPNGCLKVLTPAMIDGPAGVTALRAFVEKENLDILCVDQHSLLEDDRKAKNPVEKASNISRDLKNLQVMKKIPIIAVSQQNRASTETTGVSTAHVAQSDRISQDSTVILFIEQKKDDPIMTIEIVKSRDSVTGKKLNYSVDLNRGIFQYIPEEDNALDGKGAEEARREFESDPGEDAF